MKLTTLTLLLLLSQLVGFSNPNKGSLENLRAEYLTALSDYLNAPKVYETFLQVENPSAKILAYQAALEAIMTKTTWNIFKKISFLNLSEGSFDRALKLAPNDIEIRFMRLAVQFEIPEYLGFSDDMESDKNFLLINIESFNSQNIPAPLMEQIIGFMHRCDMFTSEELEKLKLTLTTK